MITRFLESICSIVQIVRDHAVITVKIKDFQIFAK